MSHNADGTVGMRSFHYTAFTHRRYHKHNPDIPPGEHREADRFLELHGVTDFCEISDFLAQARQAGLRLFGVVIACVPEES